MTDDNDTLEAVTGESRRSFLKRGALVSGGLALGGSTTAGAQAPLQWEPDRAFVFASDYRSETPFRVIANLPQEVVDTVLGRWVQSEPIVRITANYNAFLANYRSLGGGPGKYFILFTQYGGLQRGRQYQFATDVTFFAERVNLLEVGLISDGGGGEGAGSSDGGSSNTTESDTGNTTDGGTGNTTGGNRIT